ncbi:MAG: DUF3592 domain-containing protein [Acidobacteria bacterium]|nr:DUF3592 domain-containing protein [Acidobacteriota bacterium]
MKLRVARRAGGGCAVRTMGTVFGLVFLLAGLFFTGFMGREVWRDIEARGWTRTPCRVVSSFAALNGPDERPYSFRVRYRYRFGGREYASSVMRRGYTGGSDFRKVQLLLLRYPTGARATCWVNPENPSQAVLEQRSLLFGLIVLFPLLFVAVGAGIIALAWRKSATGPAGPEALAHASGTVQKARKAARIFCLVFGVIALGGAAAMLPWMTGPLRARMWKPVTARVIASNIRRHESTNNDGRRSVTWNADILYEYEVGGHRYRSNRWGWVTGSSSGSTSKRKLVRRHPRGSTLTVWVDPGDPTRAVAVRGYTLGHLLFLIPLAAALGAGLLYRLSGRAFASKPYEGAAPPAGEERRTEGPLVLTPGRSRIWKVVGILLFTLIWNGIISVFLWQVVQGFRAGRPDWFLTLFMAPFVLVGLFCAGLFVYAVLGLANPATTLTVTPGTPRLGGRIRVAWRTRGAAGRLQRLRLVLEGSESATYRRGNNSRTDTRVFAVFPLADLSQRLEMVAGEASLEIPQDTMHTFHAASNKILWQLKVEGEVRHWPDASDSWEIEVTPAPAGEEDPWES